MNNLNRRQVLSGIVGMGLGMIIPTTPKNGMQEFKPSIQLLIFKTNNKSWGFYHCKRDFKKETQPLEYFWVPLLNKNLVKNEIEYLEEFVNQVSSLKSFKGFDKTKFILVSGPNSTYGIASFDSGYIKCNSDELIHSYKNYNFSFPSFTEIVCYPKN